MLLPNPRGSYGGGEAFTQANVNDFGYGDLRDIEAGVDAAVKAAPIDPNRTGIIGWSYGGYMTMWAVTQTTRFKAAVAGAGIANWQSYYGQNKIDTVDAAVLRRVGLRQAGGVLALVADHLHQEGQDADAGAARRSRLRGADAAGLRVLARAEGAQGADRAGDLSGGRARDLASRSTSATSKSGCSPGSIAT